METCICNLAAHDLFSYQGSTFEYLGNIFSEFLQDYVCVAIKSTSKEKVIFNKSDRVVFLGDRNTLLSMLKKQDLFFFENELYVLLEVEKKRVWSKDVLSVYFR